MHAVLCSSLQKLSVCHMGINIHQKMKSGVFPMDFYTGGERAFLQRTKKSGADIFIVGAHPVNVFFKISVRQKAGKRILFKVRNRTGIEVETAVKFF